MNLSVIKGKAVYLLLGLIAVVIVLLPFHAFMSVWAASIFGHYTLLRLWKEFLILIAGFIVIGLFFADKQIRTTIFKNKLTWLIGAYVVLDFLIGYVAYGNHQVSAKALAYGLLDDLRFLAFFIICWAAALNTQYLNKRWQKIVLWPAAVVVAFGVLQMSVLPAGFLSHFGYGAHTIPPFQTINNNPHYVRILSTLRGSDPLGAYLILPISALAVLILRFKKSWLWLKLVFLAATIAVLIGSYSRAAWIGAFIAVLVAIGVHVNKKYVIHYRVPLSAAAVVVVLVLASGLVFFGNSKHFENIIFHTQTNSSIAVSSDQQHLSALANGVKTLINQPFGQGPGTSGPASVYNHDGPARISENYFLEVGEETGWLGMLLFIAINLFIGWELWQRKRSPFALTMLVSLIGISFANLLLLSWTDDTLSYIWWGLAGLCIAVTPKDLLDTAKSKKSLKLKES